MTRNPLPNVISFSVLRGEFHRQVQQQFLEALSVTICVTPFLYSILTGVTPSVNYKTAHREETSRIDATPLESEHNVRQCGLAFGAFGAFAAFAAFGGGGVENDRN